MDKILTISVAAYNAEKCLGKCLNSFCVPAVMDEIEVLVINDGSTDRTGEIGKDYAHRFPDTFKVIDKENGGHGSTINVGIKMASGKYFKVVDSDDWVEEDGLTELVRKLKALNADAVISPYYKVDTTSGEKASISLQSMIGKHSIPVNKRIKTKDLRKGSKISMHALTFRTEMLKKNYTKIDEHCFYVDVEYDVFYMSCAEDVFLFDAHIYDYLVGAAEQSISMSNMVRRRDQHELVCLRVMPFYSRGMKCIDDIIEDTIINQYRILLSIDEAVNARVELTEFDESLKKSNGALYRRAISNGLKAMKETAIVILLLRTVNFHGFNFIYRLIHKMSN